MTRPDFVIIGAQKSASSALMRHLSAHPAIHLPDSETRYFRDPWFHFETPQVLEDAVAGAGPQVRRRGIKCPDLLALDVAPRRISDVLGPTDLIAVLREPVARAISAYFWYMQWGWLPIAPVDEGLTRLLEGSYQAEFPRSAEILDYGHYPAQIERYREVFGADRLHVLLTDDLFADVGAASARVFEFLGVDAGVVIRPARRTVNEGVYSERRLRLLQRRHRYIMRSYPGYEGVYVQRPATAWGFAADRSIAALDRLVLARLMDNSKPPVSPSVRAALAEYYRADVARLSGLLGRDLSAWAVA